jgi:diguanylate cyclase (GGDEF)-like protein
MRLSSKLVGSTYDQIIEPCSGFLSLQGDKFLVTAEHREVAMVDGISNRVQRFSGRRNKSKLYLYGAAFVATIAILVTLSVAYLHQQVELRLAESTQRIARTLELAFEAQIDAVNVGLIAAANEIGHQNSPERYNPQGINNYLQTLTASMPNTEVMRATNAKGDVVYGAALPSVVVNVADREYFLRAKGDPAIGLIVGEPLISRVDKKWVWTFVRRIDATDRSFNGVVIAQMSIPVIESMLKQVNLNSSGIIAVRDKKFGLIARLQVEGRNAIPTGDKKLSSDFLETLKVNPLEGTYTAPGNKSIDGVSRLYSYRINPKYGFLVSNGFDLDLAMADWRKQAWGASALVLMLALTVSFIVNLTQKSWTLEAHEIGNQEQIDEQIRQIAFFDPLTQLPNRRLFNDRLIRTIAGSKRNGEYGAVMFLDLDNFKPLNDKHGHEMGDLLLMEAARRITEGVREIDTVARFGGDEFVVLLSDLGSSEKVAIQAAKSVAEKIRGLLEQPYVLCVEQMENLSSCISHHCTASIGVMIFVGDTTSSSEIIQHADAAMYRAKEDGRNVVHFYGE